MSTVSPEVTAHADRERRRHVTRKARGVLLVLVAGLACWIGAAVALAIALGVMGR